ncbi:MAG TPA: tRNA(Met) cytidine acetyltransferase, partial [Pyrodictium sp.]|nr:tRNA(Met) cytidine acetyltransferase [Pyrodictium sp.]
MLSSDFKASLEEIEKLTKKEIEEIAKKAADRLKDLVSTNYKKFTRKVIEDLQYAYKAYHRRLLVIAGLNHLLQAAYAAYTLTKYEKLVKSKDGARELKVLYVFHDEFNDAKLRKEVVKRVIKSKTNLFSLTIARYEESDRYLGTTFKVLVLDLVNDLKPNDVGRLVDVVEGGGLVIFFVPPWSKWDKWMTLFKQNLLIFGYNEPRHIFISWFKRKLMEHKGIHIYDVDEDEPIKSEILEEKGYTRSKPEPPRETRFPRKLYELAVTQDQVKVVKAMEELVEKPKKGHKKVIIVTADRGRGKSCAVGIGCIGLIHSLLEKGRRKVRILVTAPNLTSVQSFFELALKAAEELDLEPEVVKRGGNILELYGDNFSIEYWEPIDIPKKSADIVVVDEAAGIHVPLLHKIWRAHRRLVFATTIHGYEGAGRGFSVRFLSALRKDPRTELIEVEL